MKKNTTNKVAPNKPILEALKAEGWEIEINHYRQVFDALTGKVVTVKDSEWRAKKEIVYDFLGISGQDVYRYSVPHEFGGATTMKLKRGEEEVTVRAECYVKDNFCRRHGVKVCLERAFKIINPPVVENT